MTRKVLILNFNKIFYERKNKNENLHLEEFKEIWFLNFKNILTKSNKMFTKKIFWRTFFFFFFNMNWTNFSCSKKRKFSSTTN